MKNVIKIFMGITAIIMLYPVIYWVQNPDLTQIQLFIKFWHLYLFSVVFSVLFMYINDRIENSQIEKLLISVENANRQQKIIIAYTNIKLWFLIVFCQKNNDAFKRRVLSIVTKAHSRISDGL